MLKRNVDFISVYIQIQITFQNHPLIQVAYFLLIISSTNETSQWKENHDKQIIQITSSSGLVSTKQIFLTCARSTAINIVANCTL